MVGFDNQRTQYSEVTKMRDQKNFPRYLVAGALALAFFLTGGLVSAGCGGEHDLVDTAVEAGSFDTLVAAVKAAGLVEALKGDGPFTVFAPSDEAFAKLPAGTVESLLEPENKDQLTAILTYHVVSGKILSSDVKAGRVETLQGSELRVSKKNGALMVDQAKIVATDVTASNGVIHVIDAVIMPEQLRSANETEGSTAVASNLR
jgi:uncharacterized surface protein with fasciclin (FAS1) repeats